MNINDVALSIYSFGYSAGFIRDERPEAAAPVITLDTLTDLVRRHGLGGVEFPLDRYYAADGLDNAEAAIARLREGGIRVVVDLEQFDVPLIRAVLPILSRQNLRFARVKMSSCYGGNRYREPNFHECVSAFVEGLRALVPMLRHYQVKLLVENHQDLGADDLIRVIRETSAEAIGINWDIGNSLAVLDTPETFLRKTARLIGNVHLKDYRIFRAPEGFYLARCALGEGVVDFGSLLAELSRQHASVPMTIELGAQHARRADVFHQAYWDAYPPYTVSQQMEFFSFLNRHMRNGEQWKSPWERQLPGHAIVEAEMKELEQSVAFLKGLVIGNG
jgi:sugar phosphate isomerase/epimerase